MNFRKGILVAMCLVALSIVVPQGKVFAQDSTQVYEYKWSVTVTGSPVYGGSSTRTYTIYTATGSQAEAEAIEKYMAEWPKATKVRVTKIDRIG